MRPYIKTMVIANTALILFLFVALLLLTSCPAAAQTAQTAQPALVGDWKADGYAEDMVRHIQIQVHAWIEFHADGTFRSGLTTDDGTGEPGRSAEAEGEWRVSTDPWGKATLCAQRRDATGRCQPYSFNADGSFEWNNVTFERHPHGGGDS